MYPATYGPKGLLRCFLGGERCFACFQDPPLAAPCRHNRVPLPPPRSRLFEKGSVIAHRRKQLTNAPDRFAILLVYKAGGGKARRPRIHPISSTL